MKKVGICLKDEVRLLRAYTYRKLKGMESLLGNLIKFACNDLKRIDKLSELIDSKEKGELKK